jgi:hypothetical protein
MSIVLALAALGTRSSLIGLLVLIPLVVLIPRLV